MSGIEKFLNEMYNKKENTEIKSLLKTPIKESKENMPHISNNILSDGVFYESDLLFLPTDKFGYKYCLVVVDVYNSKCDAEPLKRKLPSSVESAFKKIFERGILKKPLKIQFDQGKEFKGELKDYFKEENIPVKYTLTNRHRQNASVENKNKTIGKLLMAYQNNQEFEKKKVVKGPWVKELPFLIKYLNEHLPKKDNKDLTDDILASGVNKTLIPLYTHVRRVLDYPVNAYNNKKLGDFKFRSGDIRWDKEPRKVEQWILNNNMPPMYLLNKIGTDKPDYRVAYTKAQLQIIEPNEKKLNYV